MDTQNPTGARPERVTSPEAREVLLALADRLATVRPKHTIDNGRRLAMILTATFERHGYMSDAAERLEAEVREHAAPITGRGTTRGEYALLLRAAAGGGA